MKNLKQVGNMTAFINITKSTIVSFLVKMLCFEVLWPLISLFKKITKATIAIFSKSSRLLKTAFII